VNNDSEMVDILGSIYVNESEGNNNTETKGVEPDEGLFSRVTKMLKFRKQEEPEKWQEFPWE
jgi:hypothetical protein